MRLRVQATTASFSDDDRRGVEADHILDGAAKFRANDLLPGAVELPERKRYVVAGAVVSKRSRARTNDRFTAGALRAARERGGVDMRGLE